MKKHKEFFTALIVLLVVGLLLAVTAWVYPGVVEDEAWAAGTIREDRTQWKIVDSQTIYIESGVTTLAYPATKQFWAADISIDGGPLRYFYDGRTPTSTVGRTLNSTGLLNLQSYDEVIKFKAILDSTGSGVTIYVTFFGG